LITSPASITASSPWPIHTPARRSSVIIRVERGWDEVEGEVAPKSKQGRRKVPIPAVLRDHLDAWLLVAPGERPNLPQRPRELRPRPRRRRRGGRGRPDAARVPPRLRERDDRRRREREGPVDVHGPREHQDHA
jgi:hypothetical protein